MCWGDLHYCAVLFTLLHHWIDFCFSYWLLYFVLYFVFTMRPYRHNEYRKVMQKRSWSAGKGAIFKKGMICYDFILAMSVNDHLGSVKSYMCKVNFYFILKVITIGVTAHSLLYLLYLHFFLSFILSALSPPSFPLPSGLSQIKSICNFFFKSVSVTLLIWKTVVLGMSRRRM